MRWMIFVISAFIVRIEGIIQTSRERVNLKTSEIQTNMKAINKNHEINEQFNKEFYEIAKNVSIQANGFNSYFSQYSENMNHMKDKFDVIIFDYIVTNVWDYCQKVRSLISKKDEIKEIDVESIKFEESFDYCVVTYLFNSNITRNIVDYILNPIYYLQILPNIQFSDTSDMKKNINEMMVYIVNTIKLYSEIDPGDINGNENNKYSVNELIKQLEEIQIDILDLSECFCSTNELPIINQKLVLEPNYLNASSKFIKSILNFDSIMVRYNEFQYQSHEPQYQIGVWVINKEKHTISCQVEFYERSVMSRCNHLHTQITYPEEVTRSLRGPVTTQGRSPWKIMETSDSLNTLLQSLTIIDRSSYINAVKYHNIVAETIIINSTRLGYRILRGLKNVFNDGCSFITKEKKAKFQLTKHMLYLIRSQLLQFKFYYSRLIDIIKLKLLVIMYPASDAYMFVEYQEKFQKILSLIDITSSLPRFLKDNCEAIIKALDDIDPGFYGDYFKEEKFINFHFTATTQNLYELFDYISLFTYWNEPPKKEIDWWTLVMNGFDNFSNIIPSFLNKLFS